MDQICNFGWEEAIDQNYSHTRPSFKTVTNLPIEIVLPSLIV